MKNFDLIPKEVIEDLEYQIALNGLECSDNYRAYRVSDGFLKEEYKESERNGCCGFFYGSTIIDKEKWFFACNYGH